MKYHHLGVPTNKKREGEVYIEDWKMYSSGYGDNDFRIQWLRFDQGAPFHPKILVEPHIAFQVDDMDKRIQDYPVLMEPFYPIKDFRSTVIDVEGALVELIETKIDDEELCKRAIGDRVVPTPFSEIYQYRAFVLPGKARKSKEYGIEWREPESDAPKVLQGVPYLSFYVTDMKGAIEGKKVIWEHEGRVFVEVCESPIEFIVGKR
ncbi:MAG: hypothetical protein MRY21_01635 [Simkaniaceae bacterium]|nr:hypothetical protein [Simkaniaceae bacterium]